jgi:hypothetical protein
MTLVNYSLYQTHLWLFSYCLHGVRVVVVYFKYRLKRLCVNAVNLIAASSCTLTDQRWQQYLSLKPYQFNVEYYQFLT